MPGPFMLYFEREPLTRPVSIDTRNFKDKSDSFSVELPHPAVGQGHKQLINLSVQPSSSRVPFQR